MPSDEPRHEPEPSTQTAWERAKVDWKPAVFNGLFGFVLAVVMLVAGAIGVALAEAGRHSRAYKVAMAVIWGGSALLLLLLLVFVFESWMAPRRQRDDARDGWIRERADWVTAEADLQRQLSEAKHAAEVQRLQPAHDDRQQRHDVALGALNIVHDELDVIRDLVTEAKVRPEPWRVFAHHPGKPIGSTPSTQNARQLLAQLDEGLYRSMELVFRSYGKLEHAGTITRPIKQVPGQSTPESTPEERLAAAGIDPKVELEGLEAKCADAADQITRAKEDAAKLLDGPKAPDG